jgi:hypothetical protein|nr:MAG TPA: hypothetical protein [Caudoviricetes sp.]
MRITIELQTTDGLVSPFENNLLAHIVSQLRTEEAPTPAPVAEPETKEAPKRKRPARAKKEEPKHEESTTPPSAPSDGEGASVAVEKPAAKRTTTAKKPAIEAANKTVDATEQPVTPAKADAEKLAQATALASEMMQTGNVAKLKKLLVEVSANRVSKMNGEQVNKFLELANAENGG